MESNNPMSRYFIFFLMTMWGGVVTESGCSSPAVKTPPTETPRNVVPKSDPGSPEEKAFLVLMDDLKDFDTFFLGKTEKTGKMGDIREEIFQSIKQKRANIWKYSQCEFIPGGGGIRLKNSDRKGVLLDVSDPIPTASGDVILPCGVYVAGLWVDGGHVRLRLEKGVWVLVEKKLHPLA